MGKVFKILYLALFVIFLVAWIKVKQLPPVEKINPVLLQEPIQSETTERPDFEYAYRGKQYDVKPLADYELWGLVVSKNNIYDWANYYHDKNSVNLKDVCVVWGDNIKDAAYKQKNLKFSSGEWTCYYSWYGQLAHPFYPHKLSNNHLLAENEAVLAAIRKVNVGDQIHFKGSLVDYSEKGSDWTRKTSISRDDDNQNSRSGGACEIVFVDQIDILSRNNYNWNYIFDRKLEILFGVFLVNIFWFFYSSKRRSETEQ
jgi:hypothetical protein